MESESNEAAKVYKNKMQEMTSLRIKKLESNKRITKEVESEINLALKNGRVKLTGINPFKQAQKSMIESANTSQLLAR